MQESTYEEKVVALQEAIKQDDCVLMGSLVAASFDLNKRLRFGTLLDFSVSQKARRCLEALLDMKEILVEGDDPQCPPLSAAIAQRDAKSIVLLIHAGANYAKKRGSCTSLDICASEYVADGVSNKDIIYPQVRAAILKRVSAVGYEPALECTVQQYADIFKEAVEIILNRAKERGYEISFWNFLNHHPAYMEHVWVQKLVVMRIQDSGYDLLLEKALLVNAALFQEAVFAILERADNIGFEDSLVAFIKNHPKYTEDSRIKAALIGRADQYGYEAALDAVVLNYGETCSAAIIARAHRLGYEESLRVFIEKHSQYSKDVEMIFAIHEQQIAAILAAQKQAEKDCIEGRPPMSYQIGGGKLPGQSMFDDGRKKEEPLSPTARRIKAH
jgi:hypothetical protein